jgi:hypothetical protein
MRLRHNFVAVGAALVGFGGLVGVSGAIAGSVPIAVAVNLWTGDSEPTLPICTMSEPCEALQWLGPFGATTDPAPIPMTFLEDSIGEVVTVTNTQIIVTEDKKQPSRQTTEYLVFKLTDVRISSSRIDPSSSQSFLGGGVNLFTLTSSEMAIEQVDLTPSIGDQLVVDFALAGPSAPESSTWAMLLAGFLGLGYAGARRRWRRAEALEPVFTKRSGSARFLRIPAGGAAAVTFNSSPAGQPADEAIPPARPRRGTPARQAVG